MYFINTSKGQGYIEREKRKGGGWISEYKNKGCLSKLEI